MNELKHLILRNTRLFFKDKGTLIASLLSPIILLALYIAFLYQVYRDIFISGIPAQFALPDALINGCVGGQLISSLLAVSCVSVAFSANLIMVQDKVSGARSDLLISPVKPSFLALGYYISTAINTLVICLLVACLGFAYIALSGWTLPVQDMLSIMLDVALLSAFGTALSSVICSKLSTEGQMSAVSTIISAGYGFLCGAYMPISQFGSTLQTVLSFLPGSYGTALLRNHAMQSGLNGLLDSHVPVEAVHSIRDALDCNLYFLGNPVSISAMYLILLCSVAALVVLFVLMNRAKKRG